MKALRFLPALLVFGTSARADGASECVKSAEDGNAARDGGRLREARGMFVACAAETCPKQVRVDCAAWLEDVDETIPSAVFGAKDARGADVFDITVTVDGEKVTGHEHGRAVPLDPGPHVVSFERPDGSNVEQRVLMRVGERNRAILARFPETASPRETHVSTIPTATIVLGAVGLAAAGSFAFFGVTGLNEKSDVRARCAPACGDDDISGVRSRYVAADVSLGIGIVALGLATYFFLASPRDHHGRLALTIWK